MIKTLTTILMSCALLACAPRVRVEVAAAPAVAIGVTSVAVVARDRECRPIADAMIADLKAEALIQVDPRSPVKLMVFDCAVDLGWTVYQEVDGADERRRADVEGRGHAVMAVETPYGTVAHVIGNAREGHLGSWKNRPIRDMLQTRSTIQRRLTSSVASDLVQQLNHQPQQVVRRLYPNADDGSAKQLTHLAVLAEQRGDLAEAIELASEAHLTDPSDRTAEYLASLQRRLYGQSPR